jgi:ABC-type nitrate/sulfonate/bicarbonate transport system permease component
VFAGVAILSITVIIVNRLLELVELRFAIWRPQKD